MNADSQCRPASKSWISKCPDAAPTFFQPSSKTSRTPCSTASRCSGESVSWHRSSRSLETARIWSVTATTSRPPNRTGTRRGGLAWGEVDSGMMTTLLRRSLTISLERIKQGLVFAISDPNVGSSRTHQTSPRRGNVPRLPDPISLVHHRVPILLDGEGIGGVIGGFASPDHSLLAFTEFGGDCLSDIAGPVPGGNPTQELRSQILRDGEGHLPVRHIAILPYRCRKSGAAGVSEWHRTFEGRASNQETSGGPASVKWR